MIVLRRRLPGLMTRWICTGLLAGLFRRLDTLTAPRIPHWRRKETARRPKPRSAGRAQIEALAGARNRRLGLDDFRCSGEAQPGQQDYRNADGDEGKTSSIGKFLVVRPSSGRPKNTL
jgi:hypothetical protein